MVHPQWTVNQLGDAGDLYLRRHVHVGATRSSRPATQTATRQPDRLCPQHHGHDHAHAGELPRSRRTDTGKNLTITGPGAGALTVRNDGITVDRILYANKTFGAATLSISGLTLTNGSVSGDGAIKFYGWRKADHAPSNPDTLTNDVLTANQTTGGNYDGGAIAMNKAGNLTITNSTISGNTATGNGAIGAVAVFMYHFGRDMAVTNSLVTARRRRAYGGIKFCLNRATDPSPTRRSRTTPPHGRGLKLYNSLSFRPLARRSPATTP